MTSQGLPVQPEPEVAAAPTNLREIGAVLKQSFEGFKDAVGETFDDRRDVLDPGDARAQPAARGGRGPGAARARSIGRRAGGARPRARAVPRAGVPPRSPSPASPRRAATQLEDVVARAAVLGLAAHPERVFGVYRVPDRSRPQPQAGGQGAASSGRSRTRPARSPPAADERPDRRASSARTTGRRAGRASRRCSTRTSPARSSPARGVEPEDCFGLHRLLNVRGRDTEDEQVTGCRSSRASCCSRGRWTAIPAAQQAMTAEAPLAARPPPPFHVEVLDWEAVAAWVVTAPLRPAARPVAAPAPAEHLAASCSWPTCEVVGVRSEDTLRRAGDAHRRPLARRPLDGELEEPREAEAAARRRQDAAMHVAEHVVIAYRDRAEYEAGPRPLARLPARGRCARGSTT